MYYVQKRKYRYYGSFMTFYEVMKDIPNEYGGVSPESLMCFKYKKNAKKCCDTLNSKGV